MKRFFVALVCAIALAGMSVICACSDSSQEEEKVYVEAADIGKVFSDPASYSGKYIQLTGQVFSEPEADDDSVYLQVYYDPSNYTQNYVVLASSEIAGDVKNGDYIGIDGKITGEFSGENVLGATLSCPEIAADTLEELSYIDAVVPTLAVIEPALIQEQNDFSVTLDKVEYAEKETRVYLTLVNNSSDAISYGVYNAKILMEGAQIEQDSNSMTIYSGGYNDLPYEVLAGATVSGFMVFPAIEQGVDFQLIVPDLYSDNWELDFNDMTFDVSAAQ